MRKYLSLLLLAALVLTSCAALADPVLTADGLTAWIGETDHMYLMDAAGTVRHLPAAITDLIAMDSAAVYCLTADQRVFSVYTDGSGSSIVYRNPTPAQLAALRGESAWALGESGRLTVTEGLQGERVLSETASTAVESGGMLYYVEKTNSGWLLKRTPLETADALPGLSLFPEETQVDEHRSLTCSAHAVTLTHPDGSVTVIALETGEKRQVASVSTDTVSAALVGDRLYRYSANGNGYHLQQAEALQLTPKQETVTATPVPTATPAPTVRPTATPRPTVTPTREPSPTEEVQDENIRKGERSDRVRKMQKRLLQLGYPVGSADGTYGRQTQVAVALFMSAVHVTEREYVSPSLLRKMNASNAPVYDQFLPLQKGDRGMAVRIMQEALRNLGYDPGKIEGIYGTKTVNAVAAYMTSIGWYVPPGMVKGETAPRELLMNLYLTPFNPVGPTSPTAPPSLTDQIADELERIAEPLK